MEAIRPGKESNGMITRAGIYCRVSTESQEREGTSLETQLAKCLQYCKDKGYAVSYRFSEAYSGLSLERPKLDELRQLVRDGQLDVIVIYALDRFSRDPGHGVILTQELEKYGVRLEGVSEDIVNTELGKLISYIRGFAGKLEADKIRERTMRGKKAAKEAGRIVSGSGVGLFGYDYQKRIKGQSEAKRIINEAEADTVRQMFAWLVSEGLSTNGIVYRLRALGMPSKTGKTWGKSTVGKILKKNTYAGLSNATPAIISQDLFHAAQKQLAANSAKATRNCKHDYLLRGHLRCRCGQSYVGMPSHGQYFYACLGRRRISLNPVKCDNKVWPAEKLESLIWNDLNEYLHKPEVIKREMEAQQRDADNAGVYASQLLQVEKRLKALEQEQEQLLSWALKGFPESQVVGANKRINADRALLQAEKVDLEVKIKASQEAVINIPKLEAMLGLIQSRISNLDFEGKRLALDWLNIKAIIDGDNIDITGLIETNEGVCIATTTSSCRGRNTSLPFSLRITAKSAIISEVM